MQAWPDLWIWSTDCIFYNFLYKEFINRRAMHKFEISKGNLSHKWLGQLPCLSRIILKVLSASQDRNELPGANRGTSWPVLAQNQPRWPFIKAGFNINADDRFIKADGRFIM